GCIIGGAGGWNREGRNVSVVWFYGGRAIMPSPKVSSSIRSLHEIYSGFGLDVIGVTPATDEPAIVKDAARMMKLPFPIAIDSEGEGDWGKTFDTFGLRPYTGVFLVDHKGILHTIEQKNTGFDEPSELEAVVRKLLVESGSKPLPKVVTPNEHDISDKFRQVHARWKSIVAEGVAESTLSGTISGGYNDKGPIPLAGAVVEIEPSFKMLSSNSVSSYITGGDRSRRQTAETDAKGKYRFENLPKGYYKITITADGRAFNKQELIVGEATGVTYDAELPTEHTIIGRVISAEDKLSVEEAVIKIIGRHIDPKNPDVVTKSYPQPTSQLDAEGVFAFEYLQTGKYILEISADGFKKRVMQMVPLGEKELIIQLQKED
ncbi:MAG: carboxypeptidase regulatory-like domain-containing protein, partial [Planctomycetaceae bacterium]